MPNDPKLVLHFDIRNTVLVADSVTNVTVGQALNSYLTSVAWGTVDPISKEWSWVPDPAPTICRPQPDAISFYTYLEDKLIRSPMDRLKLRQITGDFEQTPTGLPFRQIFEDHLKLLEYPYEAHQNFSMKGRDEKQYHYILPSFFNLLDHLYRRKDQQEFSVIFRTYGLDAPSVLKATDLMLNGKHPGYPSPHSGQVDHRVRRIVRGSNGMTLHDAERNVCDEEEMYRIFSNLPADVIGVVDDFHWWMNHDYFHETGKPLWIKPEDGSVLHIFFDDNIRPMERTHIVDSRVFTVSGSQSLSLTQMAHLIDKQLVQVDLLAAIREPNYYIDAVNRCLSNQKNSSSNGSGPQEES